jgi:serine protease Do
MVRGVPIREFVLHRSAFLFGVDQLDVDTSEGTPRVGKGNFRFKLKPNQMGFDAGSAAAVDRRGYFVTAAHCVEGGDVYLAFLTPTGSIRIEKARVVWEGDPSFDFALLHVGSSLDHVLKWAPAFESGNAVISAGASINSSDLRICMTPVGGSVIKILSKEHDGVGYSVILHDSPLRKGNSGGPLISEDGRLLAINFGGRSRFPIRWDDKMRLAHAVRPDFDWLTSLIERDQNQTSRTKRR